MNKCNCSNSSIQDFSSYSCPDWIEDGYDIVTDGEFMYDDDKEKTGRNLKLKKVKDENPANPTSYSLEFERISDNRYLNGRIRVVYFSEHTYNKLKEIIKPKDND